MRILVTNDDGIFSEGLESLARALGEIAEVVVVAPDREQSATSHSLTLHRPLRMKQVREHWYAVDGTPTDCVNLGIQGLLKEAPPDVVVSGINYGLNVGGDVTYSGTVSAAFEASLHHLPGLAFSQQIQDGFSFAAAARLARDMVVALADGLLSDGLLLNVNVPADEAIGVRWTRLGQRTYRQTVIEKLDPKGRRYYWIAGTPEWKEEVGTDYSALKDGYVSVTPLHLDLTDYRELEASTLLQERLVDLVQPPVAPVGP